MWMATYRDMLQWRGRSAIILEDLAYPLRFLWIKERTEMEVALQTLAVTFATFLAAMTTKWIAKR
jgi:hypothetical protein